MEQKTKFSWKDNFVVHLLVTYGLVLVGQILGSLLTGIPIGIYAGFRSVQLGIPLDPMHLETVIPDTVVTGQMYAVFIGIWIVALLWFLIPGNRPMYKAISTKVKGNNALMLLLGTVLGFVLNGLCILAAYLHQDIKLYFDSFRPISFIVIFLLVFIQSSAEELLCRGFLYQRLLRRYRKPAIAIIGNAVLFGALHLGNNGVTVLAILNIVLFGILASLIVYYMDSIWCAMAVHAAWNFTQNILFGLPNSGNVVPYSVLKLDASTAMDSFAYNVGFGVEGTIMAVVILVVACAAVWYWGEKNGKKGTDIWGLNVQPTVAETAVAEAVSETVSETVAENTENTSEAAESISEAASNSENQQ